MILLAVDDERLALNNLKSKLQEAIPEGIIIGYMIPEEALEYVKVSEQKPDIAFLDVEMRSMTGLELAKQLKRIMPSIKIIFVTGYSQYAVDAFDMHASGYLMKPVASEKIKREIKYIEQLPDKKTNDNKLSVKCFGNFEAYIKNEPCNFRYAKTKELLAYLIDRKGAFCTIGELVAILWEDKQESAKLYSLLRNIISDLIVGLKQGGCEEVIVKKRGQICILPDKLDCDYYDWLHGDLDAINAYNGEYMSQYSWSEFTLGYLEKY